MRKRHSVLCLLILCLCLLPVAPAQVEEVGSQWANWEDWALPPEAIDSEGFTWDGFRNGFSWLYGFAGNSDAVFVPMFYHYSAFAHSDILTRGEADGLNYIVHYDVKRALFEDYLLYLKKFGYDVALDAKARDIRYVELRNVNAPPYMPIAYRCYYNAGDETLVTADPAACEAAYAAKLAMREEPAQDEVGRTLTLADGAKLTLDKVLQLNGFAVTTPDSPLIPGALTGLLASILTLPAPTQTLSNGDSVALISPPYGVYFVNDERFVMLKLTVQCGSQPLNLSEYEFCLSACGKTAFACEIGAYIYMSDGINIVDTTPMAAVEKEQTFWLAFPVDYRMSDAAVRFSLAKTADRVPLPDRASLGFLLSSDYQP